MIAPARARRPGAERPAAEPPTEEELETCPFCEGREDRTPPETLVLPAREPPNSPGWRVRVAPNLYPAFARQEVVVHAPEHRRSLAELADEQVDLIAQAWSARAESTPGASVHALVNEGRQAGSSLPHTHSQLVWLPERPAAAEHGVDRRRYEVVTERNGLVLACPWASRLPYECVIVPREPEAHAFRSDHLAGALRLLAEAIRRLHVVAGATPLNAWVHNSDDWHVELLPRLTILAGVELGAGWWINPLRPEKAAELLRAAG